jgi:hypothetical protein
MRNIIIIIVLILIPSLSMGQEKTKSRKIYFGAEIGQKFFHEYSVGQHTIKGYSELVALTPTELTMYICHDFNKQNTLSLGLSIYDAFLQGKKITPTIIDYRYNFKKEDNTLFVNAGVGYTLFGPSELKSTVFKMGLGYRFSISKTKRMHIGVNYDLNCLYDIDVFRDNSSFTSESADVNVYAFNVKIGIGF